MKKRTRYSPEEIRAFYDKQRDQWKKAKEAAKTDRMRAIFAEMERHGITHVSETSFAAVQMQLDELGLDGLPFVDVKTFSGWKQTGYIVKKGERSILTGLSWKPTDRKEATTPEEESKGGRMLAKAYALFHRSQVQPIEEREPDEAATIKAETDAENRQRQIFQD